MVVYRFKGEIDGVVVKFVGVYWFLGVRNRFEGENVFVLFGFSRGKFGVWIVFGVGGR